MPSSMDVSALQQPLGTWGSCLALQGANVLPVKHGVQPAGALLWAVF